MTNQRYNRLRVLIISQDSDTINQLTACLKEDIYETFLSSGGVQARRLLSDRHPHILLVDRQLSSVDGVDLCREFHESFHVPILMLSDSSSITDKVLALEMGCDDYLTKPFDDRELIARMRAILRRSHLSLPYQPAAAVTGPAHADDPGQKCIRYDDLTINLTNYSVTYHDRAVDMPPRELELLYFLASSPNQVFTREQLLDHVWGYEYIGDTRTVDVHIKRIRARLKGKNSWSIATVWGVGYKFQTK